mmetsp:Transcript_39052/g.78841  ORF Transcript_39052/g.78841 Transcript_39052/m.78841 type:complete len:208 (-) Transcript_39052:384-1007(-)
MLHLRRNCIESKVSGRQGEHGCYGVPSEVADQSEGQCEEEDEGEKLRQVHEREGDGGLGSDDAVTPHTHDSFHGGYAFAINVHMWKVVLKHRKQRVFQVARTQSNVVPPCLAIRLNLVCCKKIRCFRDCKPFSLFSQKTGGSVTLVRRAKGVALDVGADEDGELDREPSDEIAHRPQFSRSLRVFHAIFGQSQLAGSRDAVQRDLSG